MTLEEAKKIFNINDKYDEEELKRKYYELSKKYHPDKNGDIETMQKINEARDILKNHLNNYEESNYQQDSNYENAKIMFIDFIQKFIDTELVNLDKIVLDQKRDYLNFIQKYTINYTDSIMTSGFIMFLKTFMCQNSHDFDTLKSVFISTQKNNG